MTDQDRAVGRETLARVAEELKSLSFGKKMLLKTALEGVVGFDKLPEDVQRSFANIGYSSVNVCGRR